MDANDFLRKYDFYGMHRFYTDQERDEIAAALRRPLLEPFPTQRAEGLPSEPTHAMLKALAGDPAILAASDEAELRIYKKPAECAIACPPQQVCDYCQRVGYGKDAPAPKTHAELVQRLKLLVPAGCRDDRASASHSCPTCKTWALLREFERKKP